jgi:AraC-like DNA-binding protein
LSQKESSVWTLQISLWSVVCLIGTPYPAAIMRGKPRRVAILRIIESRSGDPDLSAATVARLLGITPRYVHLLLEATGKSFTHHVLERRLERAATLLRDLRWSDRKIADIAAEAGFVDLSYFNRAFRHRYGTTPSAIRRIAGGAD